VTDMKHYLPYLGDDPAPYETALLKLFQKYPPSLSGGWITIHEAGKAGSNYTSRYRSPGTNSETAKLVAHKIVVEYESHEGQVFKGVTLDF
jgi:hypothetical protein